MDNACSSAQSQAWAGVPFHRGKDPALSSLICTQGGRDGVWGTGHSGLSKG